MNRNSYRCDPVDSGFPTRAGHAGHQPGEHFPQTRWTVVLAACDAEDTERACVALDTLCRAYWFPLYVYVRRRGYSPEDAEDLTQGYFAALIERDYLAQADRTKGRLRSFFLTTLKHFLSDEWSKASAQKRGAGKAVMSIDAAQAEERYALEPTDESSPDILYEKRWALTLLDNVLGILRQEYTAGGKAEVFDVLQKFLAWNSASEAHRSAAVRLGMKENAVRVAIFRLRRRYGDLLREAVSATVTSAGEVPAELEYLFSVLRS
jgi:DNA-directed RNA polymerase specialized sigma24 family protein